jgi:hypothetical protein
VIDDKLKQVLCVCLSVCLSAPPFVFFFSHFRTERSKSREGARISAVQLKRAGASKKHDCAAVNTCRFLSKSHFVPVLSTMNKQNAADFVCWCSQSQNWEFAMFIQSTALESSWT